MKYGNIEKRESVVYWSTGRADSTGRVWSKRVGEL